MATLVPVYFRTGAFRSRSTTTDSETGRTDDEHRMLRELYTQADGPVVTLVGWVCDRTICVNIRCRFKPSPQALSIRNRILVSCAPSQFTFRRGPLEASLDEDSIREICTFNRILHVLGEGVDDGDEWMRRLRSATDDMLGGLKSWNFPLIVAMITREGTLCAIRTQHPVVVDDDSITLSIDVRFPDTRSCLIAILMLTVFTVTIFATNWSLVYDENGVEAPRRPRGREAAPYAISPMGRDTLVARIVIDVERR